MTSPSPDLGPTDAPPPPLSFTTSTNASSLYHHGLAPVSIVWADQRTNTGIFASWPGDTVTNIHAQLQDRLSSDEPLLNLSLAADPFEELEALGDDEMDEAENAGFDIGKFPCSIKDEALLIFPKNLRPSFV